MAVLNTNIVCLLLWGFVINVRGDCPNGWLRHDDSCYIFMHESYNWFDAQDTCHYLKGTLVEIESAEENHYIAGFIHGHGASQSWIGLNDFANEGEFVWTSTLETASPTFWKPGEPSDSRNAEDCVLIHQTDGMWEDHYCESTKVPFVCEKEHDMEEIIG